MAAFEPAPFYGGRDMVQRVPLGGEELSTFEMLQPLGREGSGLGRGANQSHDFWGRQRAGARPRRERWVHGSTRQYWAHRPRKGAGKCLYQVTLVIYKNSNIY